MTLNCTWRDMMREAAGRLAAVGVENAPRDARLLLAHALEIEPVEVIMRETDAIDPVALIQYEALVQRRLAGEPVSRIRGWREFYGRKFRVTPDVLDPRPETELLVEEGLKRLPPGGRALDLGTGSGCILISLLAERDDAEGVGVDMSGAALKVANGNAASLGVASRATFLEGGWGASVEAGLAPFDLVLSNPPYIAEAEFSSLAVDVRRYDPKIALTPGGDGLGAYRAILALVAKAGGGKLLKSGGFVGLEFGRGQEAAIAGMMAAARLQDIAILEDLAELPRAAFGRRA